MKGEQPQYFVHVHYLNQCCWIAYDDIQRAQYRLNTDALFAASFNKVECATMINTVRDCYPGCDAFEVECNSKTILTPEMRKTINV